MSVSRLAAAAAGMLTAVLLQAALVGPLTFPVPVSLPALLVIVVGCYAGPGIGMSFGFATGLLADLGSGLPAGTQALCWLAAGTLGGLVSPRGTRAVAGLAALLAAASSLTCGLLLAVLGSPGAHLGAVVAGVLPVGLVDALLGLLLAPLVRALLRGQGIRPPRPVGTLVGNR